jgi:hypothetical protein
MARSRSSLEERSRVFWITMAGGIFIGINIGIAATATVQRFMGIIP